MTLADTDFFIDLANPARKFRARARAKTEEVEQEARQIHMTAVTRFELFTGSEQFHDPAKERHRIQGLLDGFPSHELSPEAADLAGKLHGALQREGRAVGALDAMIAAIAPTRSEPLITCNVSEFSRIQGLKVEPY